MVVVIETQIAGRLENYSLERVLREQVVNQLFQKPADICVAGTHPVDVSVAESVPRSEIEMARGQAGIVGSHNPSRGLHPTFLALRDGISHQVVLRDEFAGYRLYAGILKARAGWPEINHAAFEEMYAPPGAAWSDELSTMISRCYVDAGETEFGDRV
jgi:hypothetical protein